MKTKDVEEYYNKYMYYFNIINDLNIPITEYNSINKEAKLNWEQSYVQEDGVIPAWLMKSPKKPRTVINPRKATA